jgi:hypothetical protein
MIPDVETRFSKIKNHLRENGMAYLMTGVAIGIFALMQRQRHSFEGFLTEKGIDVNEFRYNEADYTFLKKNDLL